MRPSSNLLPLTKSEDGSYLTADGKWWIYKWQPGMWQAIDAHAGTDHSSRGLASRPHCKPQRTLKDLLRQLESNFCQVRPLRLEKRRWATSCGSFRFTKQEEDQMWHIHPDFDLFTLPEGGPFIKSTGDGEFEFVLAEKSCIILLRGWMKTHRLDEGYRTLKEAVLCLERACQIDSPDEMLSLL